MKKMNTGERHICEMCAKVYTTKGALSTHVRQVHMDPDKLFKCEHCGKKSNNQTIHKQHLQLHEPPTIQCPNCDLKLHTATYLKRHIKSRHTQHMQFPCTQCGKAFSTEQALNDHMNMHLGIKPYRCRYTRIVFCLVCRLLRLSIVMITMSLQCQVKMSCLVYRVIKLGGVAPLMTDPPPTISTTALHYGFNT